MRKKVQVLQSVQQIENDIKKEKNKKIEEAVTMIQNAQTLEELKLSTDTMNSLVQNLEMDEIKNTANNIEKVNVLVQTYELIARLSEYIRGKTIDYKILLTGDSINPQQMTTFTLTLDQLLSVNEKGQYSYFKFDSFNNSLRLNTSALNTFKQNNQESPLFEFITKKEGKEQLQKYTAVLQAIYNQRWDIWTSANQKRIDKGKKDDYINRGNIKELFLFLQEFCPDIFNNLLYDKKGNFIITQEFEKRAVEILKNNILKNTIPFYQAGDLTIGQQEYQVKGNDATFINISTALNILDDFINSLGNINEGSIREGIAKDIDSIVDNAIKKFIEQFIAKK